MREDEVRVIIRDDFYFAFDGLSILVGRKIGGQIHLLRVGENGMTSWERQEDNGVSVTGSSFVLPRDVLVPLLDALTSYMHGASDVRQLTEALKHEQERRDKSEDALRQLAIAGMMRIPGPPPTARFPEPMTQEQAKQHDHM